MLKRFSNCSILGYVTLYVILKVGLLCVYCMVIRAHLDLRSNSWSKVFLLQTSNPQNVKKNSFLTDCFATFYKSAVQIWPYLSLKSRALTSTPWIFQIAYKGVMYCDLMEKSWFSYDKHVLLLATLRESPNDMNDWKWKDAKNLPDNYFFEKKTVRHISFHFLQFAFRKGFRWF